MTSRVRLTEARIEGLRPKASAYNVLDALVDGLIVRVQPTGHASYMMRAKFPGGAQPVRRLVGHVKKMELERARAIVREWWEHIRLGKDPADILKEQKAKAQQARDNTLRVIAADWIREYVRNPVKPLRQADEFERLVNHDVLPALGDRSVVDITQEDITSWVKAIRDRGAFYVAFAAFGVLRSLLGWAAEQKCYGLVYSPCDFPTKIRISKVLGAKRRKRRRHLSPDELRAYVLAARSMPTPWAQFFQLLLYTGQRVTEVSECIWPEFTLDAEPPTWFISAERYKTDVDVMHPLARQSAALIAGLPRYKSGQHCLTNSWGKKGLAGINHAKKRLEKAMLEILREDDPKAGLPAFWLHDLRRNLKGGMTDLGIPDDHSEACLGHVPAGIRAHYQVSRFLKQKAEGVPALGRPRGRHRRGEGGEGAADAEGELMEVLKPFRKEPLRLDLDALARSGGLEALRSYFTRPKLEEYLIELAKTQAGITKAAEPPQRDTEARCTNLSLSFVGKSGWKLPTAPPSCAPSIMTQPTDPI